MTEVEATDELRERLWDWADQILDLWNIEDTNPPSLTEGFADLLLPALAAVVAEARTEQREQDAVIAENAFLLHDLPVPGTGPFTIQQAAADEARTQIAATIRGVGNQNAEPRWSANRLEEVLREGLPDQNAEPEEVKK